MGEKVTYEKMMQMLAKNYEEIEHSTVNQILLNVSNHYSTEGAHREMVWKSLFEMIIPKKYCIEQSVFIIDSYGSKSREVDLAIYDELYTPYIFNYGKIKFIPIEAVAAVVQCKSNTIDDEDIIDWGESIDQLVTSMDSVSRFATGMIDNAVDKGGTMQTATRPIKILCGMAKEKEYKNLKEKYDIILSVDQVRKRLFKYIRGENDSLEKWNTSLNHALEDVETDNPSIKYEKETRHNRVKEIGKSRKSFIQDLKIGKKTENGIEENVLLSLIFQLNQLLMVINNPMLFPHRAYADRFNEILGGYIENKGEEHGQKEQ